MDFWKKIFDFQKQIRFIKNKLFFAISGFSNINTNNVFLFLERNKNKKNYDLNFSILIFFLFLKKIGFSNKEIFLFFWFCEQIDWKNNWYSNVSCFFLNKFFEDLFFSNSKKTEFKTISNFFNFSEQIWKKMDLNFTIRLKKLIFNFFNLKKNWIFIFDLWKKIDFKKNRFLEQITIKKAISKLSLFFIIF